MTTEDELIASLPGKLADLLPEFGTLRIEAQPASVASRAYDLLLEVTIGQLTRNLLCEVRAVGEPRYLRQAISKIRAATVGDPMASPVIIAPYISREGRKLCRKEKVGYIDLTGNIFLSFDNVFIDKSGDSSLGPREKKVYKRLFSPVSSRVVRVVLENPKKTWTLPGLSEESKVSLSTAYHVTNLLAEKGYVSKERGAIILTEPPELLDLWAQNYNVNINPSQAFYSFARSFSSFIDKLRDVAREGQFRYALTLHSGASLVAPFVRFTDVHLYYQGDLQTIVKGLDLRPVEVGGTIYILAPYDEGVFYNLQRIDGVVVVCNTQLYLDLVNYPARGKEQADFLREQKMSF